MWGGLAGRYSMGSDARGFPGGAPTPLSNGWSLPYQSQASIEPSLYVRDRMGAGQGMLQRTITKS